jgi:hypothetical protein
VLLFIVTQPRNAESINFYRFWIRDLTLFTNPSISIRQKPYRHIDIDMQKTITIVDGCDKPIRPPETPKKTGGAGTTLRLSTDLV